MEQQDESIRVQANGIRSEVSERPAGKVVKTRPTRAKLVVIQEAAAQTVAEKMKVGTITQLDVDALEAVNKALKIAQARKRKKVKSKKEVATGIL